MHQARGRQKVHWKKKKKRKRAFPRLSNVKTESTVGRASVETIFTPYTRTTRVYRAGAGDDGGLALCATVKSRGRVLNARNRNTPQHKRGFRHGPTVPPKGPPAHIR